jgi:hypothetical protein
MVWMNFIFLRQNMFADLGYFCAIRITNQKLHEKLNLLFYHNKTTTFFFQDDKVPIFA